MPKIGPILVVGVVGLALWSVQPTPRLVGQQQIGTDSLWLEVMPGQGRFPWVVFSCSVQGVHAVTVIHHEGGTVDSASTEWGAGEHIPIENAKKPCECADYNALGNCRLGSVTQPR